MTQDKAQSAVNGYPLNKGCNAVLSHLWASLRARREAVICDVTLLGKSCNAVAERHSNARRVGLSAPMAALRLLQRTKAICCEACLAYMDVGKVREQDAVALP